MISTEKKRFAEAMTVLRDCYPGYRPSEDDFKRTMSAYWQRLETLSIEAVCSACLHAPDPEFYPDWFPAVGQLRRVAEEFERKLQAERVRQREAETNPRVSDDEIRREFLRTVPSTLAGQQAYIAEATDDWDRLARLWQCDSRRRGLDPAKFTPREVFEQRMRELWALWRNKAGEGSSSAREAA